MNDTTGAGFLLAVGDVEVYRVEELIVPTSVRWLLPDAPRAVVEEARPWLQPHFMDERGYLLQSIHAYVLKTPGHVLLVDTGVGNHKQRGGGIPAFNMLDTPFLERLAAAGAAPRDVDIVLCTHMHADHVGWDSHLVDGRWTPTFPRARHLFAAPELAAFERSAEAAAGARQLMDDSIRPIIDAGLVEAVPVGWQVCDEVRLEPSHGHSPGHVNIRVESRGDTAVFTGDVMHSPVQCLLPELRGALDGNEAAARAARLAVLERYADTGAIVLGAHFRRPGRVSRAGAAYRFEALP